MQRSLQALLSVRTDDGVHGTSHAVGPYCKFPVYINFEDFCREDSSNFRVRTGCYKFNNIFNDEDLKDKARILNTNCCNICQSI